MKTPIESARWRRSQIAETFARFHASASQHPLTAVPKISSFLRLLNRKVNSFRYSGRYLLLTLW